MTRGRNLFSLHGGCGLAVGILKNLTAGRAGIIRIVAVLGAGGSLRVGLGHRVTAGSKNFVFKGGLLRTLGILKNLTASRAGIIRIVAVLGAGGCFGIGLGQIMSGRNHPAIFGDFIFASLIGKILAAGRASPVSTVTDFGAGCSLGISFDQGMRRRNHPAVFFNFGFSGFVGKELTAVGADPVGAVAGFCTGGVLGINFCQLVANRNAAVAHMKVDIVLCHVKDIIRVISNRDGIRSLRSCIAHCEGQGRKQAAGICVSQAVCPVQPCAVFHREALRTIERSCIGVSFKRYTRQR